ILDGVCDRQIEKHTSNVTTKLPESITERLSTIKKSINKIINPLVNSIKDFLPRILHTLKSHRLANNRCFLRVQIVFEPSSSKLLSNLLIVCTPANLTTPKCLIIHEL